MLKDNGDKMNLTLTDIVKNRIDEYLEFDSSDIFRNEYNLIRINRDLKIEEIFNG